MTEITFILRSRFWWLLIKYEFIGSYYIDIIKDLKIVYILPLIV